MDGKAESAATRPERGPQVPVALDVEGEAAVASSHAATDEVSPVTTPLRPHPTEPQPAPPPASRWGVLRHKHFRVVWIAAFGSYLGNWFEFVGTQWIVTERTGSMVWVSYLGAAQLVPSFVLGLLGGITADRVNRKKLLLVTQFAMMLIAIGFAAVVKINPANTTTLLLWLLGLATAQGITIAFNNPAWQVLTPRLVPRGELVAAITLQGISFNAARAVGPALAGVIMGLWSPMALFVINAVSFIGVMIAVLTTPDAPAPAPEPNWWRRVWSDTKAAGAFVWKQPGPRAAFLACVVFGVFATPVLRFLSLFVSHVYHLQEKTFGVLTGVMGAGAVVGGLAMKFVPAWYPRHHFIPLSVLLGGVWILLFALATNVWAAGVIMFFVGWFWMWSFNSSMSSLQMLVDDSMRGRALAVCNTVALGLMPLGYFAASAVGHGGAELLRRVAPAWIEDMEGISTQIGVGACAIVLIVSGVVMMIYRTPEVDGLKPGDPGYDRVPGFWRGLTAAAHRPKPRAS
jgi:predicted MFS family arabinose efflux permease